MGKRDPALAVVQFFETAPLETARTVLAICRHKLSRRQPTTLAKLRKALTDHPPAPARKAGTSAE